MHACARSRFIDRSFVYTSIFCRKAPAGATFSEAQHLSSTGIPSQLHAYTPGTFLTSKAVIENEITHAKASDPLQVLSFSGIRDYTYPCSEVTKEHNDSNRSICAPTFVFHITNNHPSTRTKKLNILFSPLFDGNGRSLTQQSGSNCSIGRRVCVCYNLNQ